MIDLTELEGYFPEINKKITEGKYTFQISLDQNTEEEIFIINLKIKQQDTKNEHLIKFRIGVGKDKKSDSKTHQTDKPHFEIEIYKREEDSLKASIYFTFTKASDDVLMQYAKGTVVMITKIIDTFCEKHNLSKEMMKKIVYEEVVMDELSSFEPILIGALYDCYKKSEIVVREGQKVIPIKTLHNLDKYLNIEDLKPLYLPLKEMAEKNSPEEE
jgi:hypothetical protein